MSPGAVMRPGGAFFIVSVQQWSCLATQAMHLLLEFIIVISFVMGNRMSQV